MGKLVELYKKENVCVCACFLWVNKIYFKVGEVHIITVIGCFFSKKKKRFSLPVCSREGMTVQ